MQGPRYNAIVCEKQKLLRHKRFDSKIVITDQRNTDLTVTGKHRRSKDSLYPNFPDSSELICCWYNTFEGSSSMILPELVIPCRQVETNPGSIVESESQKKGQ